MTGTTTTPKPRWQDYVLLRGEALQRFWCDHLNSGDRNLRIVLPRSFDPRSSLGCLQIIDAGGPGRRDVLMLEFDEGDSARPSEMSDQANANEQAVEHAIDSHGEISRKQVQFYTEDDRRIASQQAAEIFTSVEDFVGYSDVIVDVSGMPRSIFFPLIVRILHLLDGASESAADLPNLFVLIAEDPGLDSQIELEGIEEFADFLPMFRGGFDEEATADRPRIWLPVLGEQRLVHLERIYDLVKPNEICPVLPSPSNNPRRGDELVLQYRDFLFEQLRLDPRSFVFAAEQNPFEVYRQIRFAVIRYGEALDPLGGCKAALSALSSKLMSMGVLLAAYELKQAGIEVGVAHVDSHGYRLTTTQHDAEVFGLWLAGECYEE